MNNGLSRRPPNIKKTRHRMKMQRFFAALQTFIAKQAERREQYEAEIDGRSWNHEQW